MRMIAMKTGEELTLDAMKRELARLSGIATRAKSKVDEYMDIGQEAIAIHNELVEVINSDADSDTKCKKLDALKKRRSRVDKIRQVDFIQLLDKHHEAETARDTLSQEIQMWEFKISMRKGRA